MEHKVPLECTKGSIVFNLATWISEILLMTFVSMVMVSEIDNLGVDGPGLPDFVNDLDNDGSGVLDYVDNLGHDGQVF